MPFLGASLLAAATALAAARQVEMSGGGRALDANLRLGSGGYNTRTTGGSRLYRQRYTPGSSRALYVVDGQGNMAYSPSNAFNPHGMYRATGYTGDLHSSQYQRRFRYYNR
jgi:hypothetical protein